jgi:hypothetical protein
VFLDCENDCGFGHCISRARCGNRSVARGQLTKWISAVGYYARALYFRRVIEHLKSKLRRQKLIMRKLILRSLLVALFLSAFVAMDAQAQRRRGGSQRRATSAPRAATTPGGTTTEITEARASLAEQVKLLSRFLYLYGRISGTIEMNVQNGGSAESAAQSRAALVTNFRNVRTGLDTLAERFSRTPSLASQSLRVTACERPCGASRSLYRGGQAGRSGQGFSVGGDGADGCVGDDALGANDKCLPQIARAFRQ